MTDNYIKQAINSNLSAVHMSQRHANQIMSNITEGKKVKKKLSVGFVLMMILILAIVTALAVTTLTDYFSGYAKLGGDYGLYNSEWPASAKAELVQLIVDSGFDIDQDKADKLLKTNLDEEEQDALATEILEDHFGLYTDLLSIMESQYAEISDWPYDLKALYTSLMEQYDLSLGGWGNDLPRYILPAKGDIQLEDAIPLAKDAILLAYDVADEELKEDELRASFAQSDEYGEEPVWVIEFRYKGSFGKLYTAVIIRDGTVYSVQAPDTQPIRIGQDTLEGAIPAEIHSYDIPEEQAIEIAQSVLTETLEFTHEEADACEVSASFFFHERYRQGKQPVWLVTLTPSEKDGIKVLLSYDGEFIDWAYAGKEFTNVQNYGFQAQLGSRHGDEAFNAEDIYIYRWTLEEKAAFSETWIPFVEAFLLENPYYHEDFNVLYQYTRRVYGMPAEGDITQEEALAIAQETAKQLGATDESLKRLVDVDYFFDVTDPDHPQWRLCIHRYARGDEEPYHPGDEKQYFVKIDARTGEILDAGDRSSGFSATTFFSNP